MLSKVKLRSSHLEGLAQTEQHMFHIILKSKLKIILTLSLIKMDWCGMRKTKTKDTHDETTRKSIALKECQECQVGAEIKIITNQCHGP